MSGCAHVRMGECGLECECVGGRVSVRLCRSVGEREWVRGGVGL